MSTCVQREAGKSWSVLDDKGTEIAFVALSRKGKLALVLHGGPRLLLPQDHARSLGEALRVAVVAAENAVAAEKQT